MPPKPVNMAWIVTGAYAVMVFVLSVIPVPTSGAQTSRIDVAVHAAMYGGLCGLTLRALMYSGWRTMRAVLTACLLAMSYGAVCEGIQSLLPYRSAEWMDVAANGCGVVIVGWICGMRYRGQSMEHCSHG